jgi:hypothetical protein
MWKRQDKRYIRYALAFVMVYGLQPTRAALGDDGIFLSFSDKQGVSFFKDSSVWYYNKKIDRLRRVSKRDWLTQLAMNKYVRLVYDV